MKCMINYTVDAVATAACLMQLQKNYDAVYKYCCIVYTARARFHFLYLGLHYPSEADSFWAVDHRVP